MNNKVLKIADKGKLKEALQKKTRSAIKREKSKAQTLVKDEFTRPENEDDDGYDPWSDRLPQAESLFSEDPWA